MPKLAAYLERAAFTHIREYYFENSFGLLKDVRCFVYGVNSGPAGGPIQLPKLITDYYYPPYDPARVELKKSGIALPYTINFDGRESLTVHLQAATGGRPPKDVTINFPAFLVSKNLGHFPGQIHFTGTETATLNVMLPSGTSKTLNLKFPAKNIDIKAEADVGGALNDLTSYLDGVFAAAETAAGISPRLFTTPSVRRIRQQGAELGFVAAWVDHRDTSGARLVITSTSASAGVDPMGFQSLAVGHIVINGSKASTDLLASYVQWAQVLGEEAAGIDFTQRYMADAAAEMSGGRLVTKLAISDQDGGPGAAVTLTDSSNMGDLFDVATAVPNSDTTLDTANAPRDLTALLNDAFTAAVTRQAPPGSSYEALRDGINSYFGQFDSILIGQIGVAAHDPADPSTVQPSETWTSSPPKNSGLRSVDGWRTAEFALYKKIQAQKPWNFTFFNSPADYAVMCHELGHALGYRDLYKQKDYRSDLAYLGDWSIMDNHEALSHHSAYHKWESGWIPPERIISVPPTDPGQVTDTEALLVPVEHWNDALPGQAHAQFGADLPVVQIIELDLGGDGAVIDRIEARQQGGKFSHSLPQSPAIIITNALQP